MPHRQEGEYSLEASGHRDYGPGRVSLSSELSEVGVLETTGLPLMSPVRLPGTPRKRNRYAFEPFRFSLRTWHAMTQVQEPPGLDFDEIPDETGEGR
jgi:hypothetical protein